MKNDEFGTRMKFLRKDWCSHAYAFDGVDPILKGENNV
jgi:hypothetical protein